MIKTLSLTLTMALTCSSALAGGMIGGGEVTFKSVMVCDSSGIDPTHKASPYTWVVKEIGFDGEIISDSTLRVVTLDRSFNPVRYYVTHVTELFRNPDSSISLDLWRYDIGSTGNKKIGRFNWNETSNSGLLSPLSSTGEVEELELSNCILEQ